MEIFANHKGFFIIKSLRIEKCLTLWKNGTFFYSNSTMISPSPKIRNYHPIHD